MKEDPLEVGNIEKTTDGKWEGFRDSLIRPLRLVGGATFGYSTGERDVVAGWIVAKPADRLRVPAEGRPPLPNE